MLLTREYIDKAFWQKLITIGLPVSLQSMLFALLGVVDIFMVSLLRRICNGSSWSWKSYLFLQPSGCLWPVRCSYRTCFSILRLRKPSRNSQNVGAILVYFHFGDAAVYRSLCDF